jgi:uncharacterized protein (TIGR02271 family)
MALLRLKDFDATYREASGADNIEGWDVYSDALNEKIGTVSDLLVDDNGYFRYLVVDLGFLIFGKKVLLPIGVSRLDYSAKRVYALGMTRQQAENLPEFKDNMTVDRDYEERVRGIYRPGVTNTAAAVGTSNAQADTANKAAYDSNTYNYQQEASLYGLNSQNHHNLKLYEERLIANKTRMKTGEVTVGKRVETETARMAVPVEKERVVIERSTPVDSATPVSAGEATFQEGHVARLEVYEETADIQKQAFLREEVRVNKEVDTETVEAQDTIRREKLDLNTQEHPAIKNPQI